MHEAPEGRQNCHFNHGHGYLIKSRSMSCPRISTGYLAGMRCRHTVISNIPAYFTYC